MAGTGLLYAAVTAHVWAAVAWGLPLALDGLSWCGCGLAGVSAVCGESLCAA